MIVRVYRFYTDAADNERKFRPWADNIVNIDSAKEMAKAISAYAGYTMDDWYVYLPETQIVKHMFKNGVQIF